MKRDARIGLAIILILGLSITFLVARALHNRTEVLRDPQDIARGWEEQDGSSTTGSNERAVNSPEARAQQESLQQWINGHGGQRLQALQLQNAGNQPQGYREASDPYRDMVRNLNESVTDRESSDRENGPQLSAMQFPESSAPPMNIAGVQPMSSRQPAPPAQPQHRTQTPAQPPQQGWQYTVEEGDNPWMIAVKLFGNGSYHKQIMEANPSTNAHRLAKGQKLIVPEIPNATLRVALPAIGATTTSPATAAQARPMQTPEVATSVVPTTVTSNAAQPVQVASLQDYAVQEGDTLSKIARQFYGYSGPRSTQKIMEANPGLSPTRIRVGMNLKIPQ